MNRSRIAVSVPSRDLASGVASAQWTIAAALRLIGYETRCLVPSARWTNLIKFLPAKFGDFFIEGRAPAQARKLQSRFVLAPSWFALWYPQHIGIPVFHGCYGLTLRYSPPPTTLGHIKTSILWWLEQRAAKRAPLFICVSTSIADMFKLSTARICLNAIDLDRVHPTDKAARASARARLGFGVGDQIVLMAGRWSLEKRLESVLDLLERAGRYYLVCIPARNQAVAFSELCRLRPDIRVHSFPDGIPEDVWSAVDILYMPSRYEGCSLAWIEAAARGIPPVSTLVGHLPQLALENPMINDIAIDRENIGAAAQKIDVVFSDLPKWRDFVRALAEQYHDIRKQAHVLDQIISELGK
jgi:glycosyltransferase involved in cell wall biosynthesis